MSSLGVTGEPKEGTSKSVPSCQWRVNKASVTDSYTIGVGIYERRGLKDIVADGEITKQQVGSRQAAQYLGEGGGHCAVALEVTESSRVDVLVTGGDAAKLCAPALEAAKLVESELP